MQETLHLSYEIFIFYCMDRCVKLRSGLHAIRNFMRKIILRIDQHKPAWFERDSYSILLHLTTDNWPFLPTKYLAKISLMWRQMYIRLDWRKRFTAIQHLPMFCSSFHSFAFYLDGMNINTTRFIFLLLKIWIAETFE